MKFDLTVIVPAYNEEKRIKKTLEIILNYLQKNTYGYEIIIIEDASTDKTFKIISDFKNKHKEKYISIIKNKINLGKGYSIKQAIFKAKKQYVLFTDADNSTPISELPKFIKLVEKYDVLIASRNLNKSKITKQPLYRRLPGKIFPILVRLLLIKNIKDTQCGFKMFKTDQAKKIFKKQTIKHWAFDAETLFISKKLGYSIKEIPVRWINDSDSKLKIFKDPFYMFIDLLKIKLNDLKGVYN